MMKKLFALCLATLMIFSLCCVTVFAAEEKDVKKVNTCDVGFGSFAAVVSQKTEGRASLELPMKDEGFNFANSTSLSVIDISEHDTLAIDFYMTDPLKIASSFSEFTLELTSSGTIDNAEIAFHLHGELKSAALRAEPGWTTVYFYFENASRTSNPDVVDLTKINFIRIFGKSAGAEGLGEETLLIDNIRVCNTGGPTFEHLDFDQYRGDNSDVEIKTEGMSRPDVDSRQDDITNNAGEKLDVADQVVVPENFWQNDSVSVNGGGVDPDATTRPTTPTTPTTPSEPDASDTPDQPDGGTDSSSDMMVTLVIVICAAVILISAAVLVLVVVLTKAKNKN